MIRICDSLPFGDLADEAFAVLGESDDRGCGAIALRIGNDNRFAAFHHCHA